ncbi:MAG: hypothetical protein ACE5EX_12685 [Phycisphaerae bacterium]
MIFTVNRNPSRAELRKFGAAMLIGFGIIGAILFFLPWIRTRDVVTLGWTGTGSQVTAVALQALGVALCLLACFLPSVARPVYVVWMTVGLALGTVMSTILLTVLFVLLLPLFSLIVRRGDPLRRKRGSAESYWEDYKPHEPTLQRTGRPF